MKEVRFFEGHIVSSGAIAREQRRMENLDVAHDEAMQIVSEAQQEAARIVAAAEAQALAISNKMRDTSDAALARFMDVQAVENVAGTIESALRCTQDLRADFEAFAPWMTSFVRAAIMRIIHGMPPAQMWDGLLTNALREVPERWNLIIRCHPAQAPILRETVSSNAALDASIADVIPDNSLQRDACLIESNQGVTDVSIATQIVPLVYAIENLAKSSAK